MILSRIIAYLVLLSLRLLQITMPSSSSSSVFNFNDLPSDIQSLTFHHLEPVERASITSTCQEWYQLIVGTQGYWRDLKVGKGCSFERLMEMLQAFTARSQNTMNSVVIDRFTENVGELQTIFNVVTLSSSTVRILSIRQDGPLGSLSRRLAFRSLPRLYLLRCERDESLEPLAGSSFPIGSQTGLSQYETEYLVGVLEDEMEWLSHLVTLKFYETNSVRKIISILRSNTSTLKTLDWTSVEGSEDRTLAFDPLVFEVLSDLYLPTHLASISSDWNPRHIRFH